MNYKLITDFIKKHPLSYIIGFIFMFLTSYIQSLFPKILGDTIDILKIKDFSKSAVYKNIIYLLIIAAAVFITTYCWRNLIIVNARKFECSLRESLFYHFQTLSSKYYSNHKTGDLIAYAINDISAVRMTFGPAAAMSVNGIALCLISIFSMIQVINLKITLIALLPIPAIILFMLKIGSLIQKRFRRVQECFAAISDRVQENIYGIRIIKSYVQEFSEMERFQKLNDDMTEANIKMVRISSYLSPLIEISFSISFVINLIWGGNMVLNGTISLGSFIAFNGYLTMIMNPVKSIGRIISIFQRGLASLKRINAIFNENSEITEGKLAPEKFTGSLEFKNLSFSYDGNSDILNNINFEIPAGSSLGIIGETGSGKSTLANLLLKLYNAKDGMIFIDGHDINEYSLSSLRSAFGYVPQENLLFSASVYDNIKFFKSYYSDYQAEDAARIAHIEESIMKLPDGFKSHIGERGVNLSGGQKQRIAIARALIKNPPILILDDSLSAVDTITEDLILRNLRKVRKNKTSIIIAHRISAVENLDNIIVMSKGKIAEAGKHDELMEKGGLYYEIFMEQNKESEKSLLSS